MNESCKTRSHFVEKIKTDELGKRKLKARCSQHGDIDEEKDQIRKDSENVQVIILRLLLSPSTFPDFKIWTLDLKLLQSGPLKRYIYVRTKREWHYASSCNRGSYVNYSPIWDCESIQIMYD